MSHPFTPEYMQDGETSSNQTSGNTNKRQGHRKDAEAHRSQIHARQTTRISTSESVIELRQTDQTEENPDGDIDVIREEMNIKITDEERLGFIKIMRMAIGLRMKIFANEVSILGLSYLVKPSSNKVGSIIRKIMWTMLLLLGTGFMVFQIYDRISYYKTYPTIVNYRVAYNRSLRFPTVTICSEYVISKKALRSLGPRADEYASVRFPPIWSSDFGDTYTYNALSFAQMDYDWEFLYDYAAAKMKDMILECSFGNQPCDSSDVPNPPFSDEALCSSFNPATSNYVTTQPGANYGLRLVLWLNQSDSFLIGTPGVGYRVVLHDPSDTYGVQELGFRVGTGISASVSFSLRNVSMLPSPYGDCRLAGTYHSVKCLEQCTGNYVVTKCGCRPLDVNGIITGPVCSLDQTYNCAGKFLKLFASSGAYRQCDCPLQCYQLTYPHSVSTSPLSRHFLNYMSQRSQFKGRNLTMSRLSKELTYLDVFYSQLSYVDIQTIPAYDFLTLVCDIGGALGLILGGTLLTVVEFVQLFVQLLNEIVTSARFARMQRS